MNGVITLLTDFGWDDPYVAELKSALLEQWTRFPDLASPPTVVDLCHTLGPRDVEAAHWFLARLHAGFPLGTVHVAVSKLTSPHSIAATFRLRAPVNRSNPT